MSAADNRSHIGAMIAPNAASCTLPSLVASTHVAAKLDQKPDSESSSLTTSLQVNTFLSQDHQRTAATKQSEKSSSGVAADSSEGIRNEIVCTSTSNLSSLSCRRVEERTNDTAAVVFSHPIMPCNMKIEEETTQKAISEVGETIVEIPLVKSSDPSTSIPFESSNFLPRNLCVDQPSVVSKSPPKQSIKKEIDGKRKNETATETMNGRNKFFGCNAPTKLEHSLQMQEENPSIKDIVIGLELPPTTLTRHFSFDASVASSLDFRSVGSTAVYSKSSSASLRLSVSKPGDVVSAPTPNDVLFPLTGMAQWPGNELFLAKIESRRHDFLSSSKRSAQARIALEVIKEVIFGANAKKKPVARFLTKKMSGSSVPGICCPWVVMDETCVLVQLGKAFRSELDVEKRIKKEKPKTKTINLDKKKSKKKKHKTIPSDHKESSVHKERLSVLVPAKSTIVKGKTDIEEVEGSDDDEDDPLVAIKSLIHIPPYAKPYVQAQVQSRPNVPSQPTPEYSFVSAQNHSGETFRKIKTIGSAPIQTTITSQSGVAKRPPSSAEASGEIRKRPYKRRTFIPVSTTVSSNEAKLTSKVAAFVNEGELVLPKGVTVRPSGKWQAQTYFAGQSRYVGVYPTSRLAAHAYRVVQSQLKIHRRLMNQSGREYSECSKEEVSAVFTSARREADNSVKDLEAIIAAGDYKPLITEQQLLSALELRAKGK